jgi:hypothetical protein
VSGRETERDRGFEDRREGQVLSLLLRAKSYIEELLRLAVFTFKLETVFST